jgi:hypothetical protein
MEKLISQIEKNEILNLANQIKAEQKELRIKKELERKQKVCDLIKTFKELQPEESESIIKDILKHSRPIDFIKTFKRSYANGTQFCSYDGQSLTVLENGTIKLTSLPIVIFLRKFKLDFDYYYKGNSVVSEISQLDYDDQFEKIIGGIKKSDHLGYNLTKVAKNKIENKVLSPVIKQQKKTEIKAFKTSLKK